MITDKETAEPKRNSLVEWRKRNSLRLKTIALVVSLVAPFGLYWSLTNDRNGLSAVFFSLIVAAMLLTLWAA